MAEKLQFIKPFSWLIISDLKDYTKSTFPLKCHSLTCIPWMWALRSSLNLEMFSSFFASQYMIVDYIKMKRKDYVKDKML